MMGIKQKDENSAGGLHNTLAAGTNVKGNIITETDFRLDGQVDGDINCSGKNRSRSPRTCSRQHYLYQCRSPGRSGRFRTCHRKLVLKATQILKETCLPSRWK